MRIDDSNLQKLTNQATRKTESNRVEAGYGKARDASSEETAGTTDTFELSSLSAAIRVQSEDSPERAAKLEKLAKAYASGAYQPDSLEIGKKIVEEASANGEEKPGKVE